MRSTALLFLLLLSAQQAWAQDENTEDVFEMKPGQGSARVFSLDAGRGDDGNEGMDSFQMFTEMMMVENLTETTTQPTSEVTSIEQTTPEVTTMEQATSEVTTIEQITPEMTTAEVTTMESMTPEVTTTEMMMETTMATRGLEPITPLDPTLTPFNITPETQDDDVPSLAISDVTDATTSTTEPSTPIEDITGGAEEAQTSTESTLDDISDRRVLKEKEVPLPLLRADQFNTKIQSTTTAPVASESTIDSSDPSTLASEEEPFDESAVSSLFEQDGSFIDVSLTSTENPPFPIVEMSEEDTTIIKQKQTTTDVPILMTEAVTTTEATTTPDLPLSEEASEEPSSETETQEFSKFAANNANSSKLFSPEKAARTPLTIRITSIAFNDQFADPESGPFKKLVKTVTPSLIDIFSELLEDNLVDVQVNSFTKGSVIVHADLLTKRGVTDPQKLANDFEAQISNMNSELAGNQVDSLSVTVDGIASRAYVDSLATQPSAARSSLVLIVIITSVVLIIISALIIILLTNKRKRSSQGSLKLSDDNLVRIENATAYTNHPVHLMSYGGSETAVGGGGGGEKVAYKSPQRQNEREI